MSEVCAKCESVPIYVTVDTSDQSGPSSEQHPFVCSNPRCEYSRPDARDFGWLKQA